MVKFRSRQIYILLLFFRTSSWNLKDIQQKWWQIVQARCPAITINGRHLIAGDGIRPGAPRKYGAKLKPSDLFEQRLDSFQKATIDIYGNNKTILFLCLDLLWKPIKEKVRFVLVIDGSETFILMCPDLTLLPADIIIAYGYRFKIEVNFKVVKHVIGAFFCHFWTSVWPGIAIPRKATNCAFSPAMNINSSVAQTCNSLLFRALLLMLIAHRKKRNL